MVQFNFVQNELKPPVVMTFAATDPTSGAGLQADLLTYASLGCYGVSVVTGITVQDTTGVSQILPLDPELVRSQARTILEDMQVDVFKIGVLSSIEVLLAVAEVVGDYIDIPLIVDPVFASGRGDEFSDDEMIEAMCDLILPQTTLLTPNTLELTRLLEHLEQAPEDPEQVSFEKAAKYIIDLGCENVLITGTHHNTQKVMNHLYGQTGLIRTDSWKRLTGNYHGSGCTLASAIAALFAQGIELEEAVLKGQEFTWKTLNAGLRLGMGQALPDRFFWTQENQELNI